MRISTLLVRFLQQRAFANTLTGTAIAMGVALTASILTLRIETEHAFSQKDTGYEIIIGAKGSPLQLVLNTIYHIGAPVGNFPLTDCERLQADKRVKFSLPMVFGDNVAGYKVIGTTPELFTAFEYRKGARVSIAKGRPFGKHFEAVLGAEVAANLRLSVGDSVVMRHGIDIHEQGTHEHGTIPIVGVLAPTATALDRAVYMTMWTIWDVHYHEYQEAQEAAQQALEQSNGDARTEPAADSTIQSHEHHGEHHRTSAKNHTHAETAEARAEHHHALPPEFTTVTALVVRLKSPVFYDSFVRNVNENTAVQAAVPMREIAGLFQVVGNISGILLSVSYISIILGAISIIVALYTSLNERRREIAILRSLGAHRYSIVALIVGEASAISVLGSIVGILVARFGLILAQPFVQNQIGVQLTFSLWYNIDTGVVFGVVGLTILVSLLPAWIAYRTDVAKNLAPIA